MEIRQDLDQLIVAEWIAVDERCALEERGDRRRRPQRPKRMCRSLLETVEAAHRAAQINQTTKQTFLSFKILMAGEGFSELIEKAQIIFIEQANVVDPVAAHAEPLDSHAEGEAAVLVGIVADRGEHVRIDPYRSTLDYPDFAPSTYLRDVRGSSPVRLATSAYVPRRR